MSRIPVKNIIFDLGGVLLEIDYNRPVIEFKKLGINTFDEISSQYIQAALIAAYETGKLDNEQFIAEIHPLTVAGTTATDIINAWNSILLDYLPNLVTLLEKLASDYRIFLFSNTNELHIEAFEKKFDQTFPGRSLAGFFEKAYYSPRFGYRKPDPAGFLQILEENGLIASETLFIDDSAQHIASAKKIHLQTGYLDKQNGDTLEHLLENYLR